MSPFLAWGDFHARSRFARPTIPEEKWGTTRSLLFVLLHFNFDGLKKGCDLEQKNGAIAPFWTNQIPRITSDFKMDVINMLIN